MQQRQAEQQVPYRRGKVEQLGASCFPNCSPHGPKGIFHGPLHEGTAAGSRQWVMRSTHLCFQLSLRILQHLAVREALPDHIRQALERAGDGKLKGLLRRVWRPCASGLRHCHDPGGRLCSSITQSLQPLGSDVHWQAALSCLALASVVAAEKASCDESRPSMAEPVQQSVAESWEAALLSKRRRHR